MPCGCNESAEILYIHKTEVDFQSSVNSFGPGSGATVFKAFSGAKPPI